MTFEPTKESHHILCPPEPFGNSFRILGLEFDTKLRMHDAVLEIVENVGWKIQMLHRVRRFYRLTELVGLYKSHVLSYIEYRTPAIHHAIDSVLVKVDRIQKRF